MDNNLNTMKVTLGGKVFIVPQLVAKEKPVLLIRLFKIMPLFGGGLQDKSASLASIGEGEYNALLDIAFIAIHRRQPELTKENFLEMPVTLSELIAALHVIAQQTGIFQKPAANENEPLGERAVQEIPS